MFINNINDNLLMPDPLFSGVWTKKEGKVMLEELLLPLQRKFKKSFLTLASETQ